MAVPTACPGHGHPLPWTSRQWTQARPRTREWARTQRWLHQAQLTFPSSLGTGGNSCCSQLLFMHNDPPNYIWMLLESLVPPDSFVSRGNGKNRLIPEWFLEDWHRQLSPCLPLRDTRPARGWTAPWHPCPVAGHPAGPRAHPGAGVVPSVVAQAGTELEPLPRSLSAAEPGLSALKPRQIPQIPLPASLWQRRPSRAV